MQQQPHAPDRATNDPDATASVLRARYPVASVVRGVARAAAGTGLTLTIWLSLGAPSAGIFIAAPLAGIFIMYGCFAALRGLSVAVVDDVGVVVTGPLGGAVSWAGLAEVRLAFYATRRRPESARNGWMVLKLRGSTGRISIESEIEHFQEIANICRKSAAAATAANVILTPATLANFAALDAGATGPVRGLRSVLAQR